MLGCASTWLLMLMLMMMLEVVTRAPLLVNRAGNDLETYQRGGGEGVPQPREMMARINACSTSVRAQNDDGASRSVCPVVNGR
jgi:hypothetical protein